MLNKALDRATKWIIAKATEVAMPNSRYIDLLSPSTSFLTGSTAPLAPTYLSAEGIQSTSAYFQ
jgi:hypothetical protein